MSAGMNEYMKIALTGISAALLTNLFGYWRDRKTIHSKYLEETLKDLYIPLIKEVGFASNNDFTHLTQKQVENVSKLLSSVPHLVDRNLARLSNQFREDFKTKEAYHTVPMEFDPQMEFDKKTMEYKLVNPITSHYSVDLRLKFEILKGYNTVRKSLGLPYDLKYVSIILRSVLYLLYLIKDKIKKK